MNMGLFNRKDGGFDNAEKEALRIIEEARKATDKLVYVSDLVKAAQREAERIKQEAIAECEEIKRKTIVECEELKRKSLEETSYKPHKTKLFSFPLFSFLKQRTKNKSQQCTENNRTKFANADIVPVLRINITNYYNCITYQLIRRATDRIFKERDIFSTKYNCPNEKEIRAVTGSGDSTINREATSAYFADYVLEGLDENFKKQAYSAGISYFRRHDDIFLIGNKERCKKVANYICKQLQVFNFTFENDKNYLSSNDRVKVEEILKTEPYNIVRFYIDYIRNVDTHFYKEMQKYTCV